MSEYVAVADMLPAMTRNGFKFRLESELVLAKVSTGGVFEARLVQYEYDEQPRWEAHGYQLHDVVSWKPAKGNLP